MQVIVLGMHRTGTSLTTRLINMMGAYFGPEGASMGFHADNPKGFWERRDVLRLNRALMQAKGCNWFDLRGWDFTTPPEPQQPTRREIRSLVLELDAHRPFVLKDPRFCLTLPCWQLFLEMPVAVMVSRDPAEVAQSLQLRDGFPLEFGLALWECYSVSALNAARELPVAYVKHEAMLADPVTALRGLHADLTALGVQALRLPEPKEITAFVEPKLHRAKADGGVKLGEHHHYLNRLLRGEEHTEEWLLPSEQSTKVMHRLAASLHKN